MTTTKYTHKGIVIRFRCICFHYQSGDHSEIIKHMARLVDSIEVPAAKAAILWVMGEYCERVPKIAPDVLRKMAKSFTNEDPAVKMQVMV